MRLKGEMVIELTDTNTGAVETVQETNMITEAVNNILGLNPMGIYLKASGEYDNSVLWNGTLLPICPNMIGGILLFPAVLEEKADHIYEQGKNLPVAYASNNVNSGSNVARGSLNQTESKKLDNGYKFVWEFTPSQGNGNIAAVALTSALGGQNAFGSAAGDASTFLLLKKVDIGDIPKAKQMTLFEAVELDFEKNLLYSITFGTSSVTITKIRIPVFNIGLNEKLDDTTYIVLEEQTLTTESFTFLGITRSTGNLWTDMTDTGMDFPMSRMLPGMRRWCGSGSPKRIIPLRREAGHCPRRSCRKWAQGQRTVPIRSGM